MRVQLDWNEYARTARKMAAEGIVMLRNEDETLPVRDGEKLAVFGRIQLDYYKSGTGSGGMVNAPYVTNIIDGLTELGAAVDETVLGTYKAWVAEHPFDKGVGWGQEPLSQVEMPLDPAFVEAAAERSDIALVVIGRSSGEDRDAEFTPGSYLLTEGEEAMLAEVSRCFDRYAVLLNVGAVMDMQFVEKYEPGAVLYLWQGGQEGGRAAADVITGRVSPSGHLADTILKSLENHPAKPEFGREDKVFYREDIYVGYRYFESFAREEVAYPFGYGLSYTNFRRTVEDVDVIDEGADTELSIKVMVENTGKYPGREVLQLYGRAPQGKLGRPRRELLAYDKTETLSPGEKTPMLLRVKLADMAGYDDSGVTGHPSAWVLEAGSYRFYLGGDVRNAAEVARIELGETVVTEQLEEALRPTQAFERIHPVKNTAGALEIAWEPAPLRSYDLAERIAERRPLDTPCTGDRGLKFTDLMEGRCTMEAFLAQLTNEELIPMTRGEGMCSPKVTPGIAGSFGGVTERLNKDYGIPLAGVSDGPSGIRMDCGTMAYSLPNGTLMACSFDKELTRELYRYEGLELRLNGIDSLLGPGINIHRYPLNGRNFEYFSEDPYLTGTMTAAQLSGMAESSVTGTIKHMACNSQETARRRVDAVVSERALREIYLKAFEIAVKQGGAYLIMTSYNPVNGIWSASNYDMDTTILRDQWGFKGMVMTDWWADSNDEGQPGDLRNTTAMIRAQNDVFMVVGDAQANLLGDNTAQGLADGRIGRGELLRTAANVLTALMKSPAAARTLGETDEVEEANRPESHFAQVNSMPAVEADPEQGTELPLEGLITEAGTVNQYRLTVRSRHGYYIRIRMHSDLGDVAQMTLSVSVNGTIRGSRTIRGNGETVIFDTPMERSASVENYVDLHFAQSGIVIDSIALVKMEENK